MQSRARPSAGAARAWVRRKGSQARGRSGLAASPLKEGQHAMAPRHPIHGMAATPLRKSKVRRIDSRQPQKMRLSLRDFLAAHIPARRARMITAIAIIVFIAWFLVFIFQPGPSYELSEGHSVPIGTE